MSEWNASTAKGHIGRTAFNFTLTMGNTIAAAFLIVNRSKMI
jgi:hypothetical protein